MWTRLSEIRQHGKEREGVHGGLPPGVAVDLAVRKREGTLTVVAPFCSQPEPR